MQTAKSKNPNTDFTADQLVDKQVRTFENTLDRFFQSNDSIGHISFLTTLCQSYMGKESTSDKGTGEIADGVHATNEIKVFLDRLSHSFHYLGGLEPNERDLLAPMLDAISWPDFSDLLDAALQEWIHPDDQELTVSYMKRAATIFDSIVDIITICNKLNNHFHYSLSTEGGLTC